MEFQPVKASDKAVIDRYMKKANSRSCDMSFAAVYLGKTFIYWNIQCVKIC